MTDQEWDETRRTMRLIVYVWFSFLAALCIGAVLVAEWVLG